MTTESHGHGGRKGHQQKRNPETDLELKEIRARMEKLAFEMQQSARAHWVYEWPMKTKVKWPIKELLARGQKRLLKIWLRYTESLRDEEEMVHICEPETEKNLSDEEEERSDGDLVNRQMGRGELSNCQVGNGKRSDGGLVYCQESSVESSYCQVGNEMGSGDLIDCQVGREEIPYCQVGKGEKMRPCESLMNSEVSSDQREEMTEKDQRNLLIIGGIRVFLPHSQLRPARCCRCNNRRTTNRDCQRRGKNGADIRSFPRKRRRAFNRMAQNFQPGS
jgi:hypothetical protein